MFNYSSIIKLNIVSNHAHVLAMTQALCWDLGNLGNIQSPSCSISNFLSLWTPTYFCFWCTDVNWRLFSRILNLDFFSQMLFLFVDKIRRKLWLSPNCLSKKQTFHFVIWSFQIDFLGRNANPWDSFLIKLLLPFVVKGKKYIYLRYAVW